MDNNEYNDVLEHGNMCIAKPAMNSGELDDI